MDRAFDAMKQFAIGNEVPLYLLALNDAEAVDFIQRLHPDFPIDWVRDPWPGEVVPPDRELLNGKVYCCRTVGEIQDSIRVMRVRDAARTAAAEALKNPLQSLPMTSSGTTFSARLRE